MISMGAKKSSGTPIGPRVIFFRFLLYSDAPRATFASTGSFWVNRKYGNVGAQVPPSAGPHSLSLVGVLDLFFPVPTKKTKKKTQAAACVWSFVTYPHIGMMVPATSGLGWGQEFKT